MVSVIYIAKEIKAIFLDYTNCLEVNKVSYITIADVIIFTIVVGFILKVIAKHRTDAYIFNQEEMVTLDSD